jgi:hypothetical protein
MLFFSSLIFWFYNAIAPHNDFLNSHYVNNSNSFEEYLRMAFYIPVQVSDNERCCATDAHGRKALNALRKIRRWRVDIITDSKLNRPDVLVEIWVEMADGTDFNFNTVVSYQNSLWPDQNPVATAPQRKGVFLIFGFAAIKIPRVIVRGGYERFLIHSQVQPHQSFSVYFQWLFESDSLPLVGHFELFFDNLLLWKLKRAGRRIID